MAKNVVTSNYTSNYKIRAKEEPLSPNDEYFGDGNYFDGRFGNTGMKKSLSMSDIETLIAKLLTLEKEIDKKEVYQRYEKPQMLRKQVSKGPSGLTIPQSPMLRSKLRSRPRRILSTKEKEEQEFEKLKKYKFKANPIPKSVVDGPKNLPKVTKKPLTVPEPFKLTEVHKIHVEVEHQFIFKARPAPKHILKRPHIPLKPAVHVTKPVSPKILKQRTKSVESLRPNYKPLNFFKRSAEKATDMPAQQGPSRPVPFSFEKRNEQLKKRKEERIKQQIEGKEAKPRSSKPSHCQR